MRVGNDFLAAVLFEQVVLKSLRKGDAGGIFLNTFYKTVNGKKVFAKPTVQKILKTNKLDELVIHLAPFDNSHAYPISKLQKQILADAKWCEEQAKLTTTKLLISPMCENNHSASELQPLYNDLNAIAPSCQLVNSTGKRTELPGVLTEVHIGNPVKPPIWIPKNEFTVSFDGFGGNGKDPKRVDFPDARLIEIVAPYLASGRCRHIRGWNFRHNGKKGYDDTTPVATRNCFPNVKYLNFVLVSLEGAIAPEPGDWPNTRLLKTSAEDGGGSLEKTKDCRIMCILPDVTAHSVDVFDSHGTKIDTWRDLGLAPHPTPPKGKRFYSSMWMQEVVAKAFKNTGSYKIRVGSPNTIQVDGRLRNGYIK